MALQGHVKTISLIEIFQFLSACLHTGTLTVRSRHHARVVFFVSGAIHLPRKQAFTVGRIGDFLVKQGTVGLDRVYSALEEQKSTGKLLGTILTERGDLTEQQLESALIGQYKEELYQVFIWDDATFAFEKDVVPDVARDAAESIILKADTMLMEAARRIDEWQRLIAAIPSLQAIFCCKEGASGDVDALAAARKVNFEAALINGERSVNELFAVSREGMFQVAEFLFALIEADLVAPLPGSRVIEAFREAIKTGNYTFAISLILHGYSSEECDSAVIRELEATLFKTRAFIKATARLTIPQTRVGPPIVEFVHTVIKNMMNGVLTVHTATDEIHFVFERHGITVWSPRRDLIGLEKFLAQDTRISPIDIKKLVLQVETTDQTANTVIESSGIVTPRLWHEHKLDILYEEVLSLALLVGMEASFEKNSTSADLEIDHSAVVIDTGTENAFFNITETLGRWIERAEGIPNLDMVLVDMGAGSVSSSVIGYVNGRASVHDIIERSKLHPVATYDGLLELVELGHARPLDASEMVDTVQHLLSVDRTSDALRLCRAAISCDLDTKTFEQVIEAIVEEHGDVLASDKEYRLSGQAGDFSLAEVLQSLHTHSKSGTLTISDGNNEREIFFQQGNVFYLRTEDAEKASFGSQFLDFDLQDMTEGLFGDEQIPTGEVHEDNVGEELVDQIKEEVYDTFIWDNASFIFSANSFPPEFIAPSANTTKLGLSTDRFMMQAVSIIQDWEAIQLAFSMKTIFKFVSSEAKMQAVSDLGTPEVLYLIDGRLNVKSIVRRSGFDKLRVCKLLFDLLEAGWIQPLEVDDLLTAATAAIEKNDDPGALTYLGYALELDPSNDDVRSAIEQISGASGSSDD